MERVQAVRQFCEFCGSRLFTASPLFQSVGAGFFPYQGHGATSSFPQSDTTSHDFSLLPDTDKSHDNFDIDFDIDEFCAPLTWGEGKLQGPTAGSLSSNSSCPSPEIVGNIALTSANILPRGLGGSSLHHLLTPEGVVHHTSPVVASESASAPDLPLQLNAGDSSEGDADCTTARTVCLEAGLQDRAEYEKFLEALDISQEKKDLVFACRQLQQQHDGLCEYDVRLLELKVTGKSWSWITEKYHQWTGKKRQKATLGMRLTRLKNDPSEKNKQRSEQIKALIDRGRLLELEQRGT